jgi:predicted GIY-YIG superfamily endonuclease
MNQSYIVYALKSKLKDWIYVGMTTNLEKRLHYPDSPSKIWVVYEKN